MAEALKHLFSHEKLEHLSVRLKKELPFFNKKAFLDHFKTAEWHQAELKQRVTLVSKAMRATLPENFEDAVKILIGPGSEAQLGFFGVCFPEFVSMYGKEHWKISMEALGEFTKASTSEFAIRTFILLSPERAMKQMVKWSKSKDVHQRRLSSEGCRPRLPWGVQLVDFVKDPQPILPILENLKNDPELYVRKSVANNLNDISKDHPDIVLAIAKKWLGQSEHTYWIVKHGLRTLLKKGNKKALQLFGHHDAKGWQVKGLMLKKESLNIGDDLFFSFEVLNLRRGSASCRLEYAIDYVKSGSKINRKVFQISKITVSKGATAFNRKQSLKNFTTRKHYPGLHAIHILLNGEVMATRQFMLSV